MNICDTSSRLNSCLDAISASHHPFAKSVYLAWQLSGNPSALIRCKQSSPFNFGVKVPQTRLLQGAGSAGNAKAGNSECSPTINGEIHSRSELGSSPRISGPERPLSLTPASHTKVIHFIRHAQGFHNIGFEANEDAHLTPFGWRQTEALKMHLRTLEQPLKPQVVIVSPLTRTLETASGVFGDGPLNEYRDDPIMMPTKAVPTVCSKHDAIAKPTNPLFVACELCRERIGPNPCDRRKSLKLTKAQFPGVDFSLIQSEDDDVWDRVNSQPTTSGIYPVGESEQEVEQRGMEFLHWLMQRPESRIAVVSHAGFLRHMLANFAHSPQLDDALVREFNNCELRTMYLSGGTRPQGLVDSTSFPGGTSWLHDPRFRELADGRIGV